MRTEPKLNEELKNELKITEPLLKKPKEMLNVSKMSSKPAVPLHDKPSLLKLIDLHSDQIKCKFHNNII
jgi:hypothetical protein